MTDQEHSLPSRKLILNILLAAVAAFFLYQVYALSFSPGGKTDAPRSGDTRTSIPAKEVVQLNVLNGCGVGGVGQRMTSYLRSAGYDVVEMGNYKTFDVKQSIIIDRSGNGEVSKKIAADLGIDPKNVVQQLSSEYFVTASVVIGKDFKSLRAWK
jgi:hypothetical protein